MKKKDTAIQVMDPRFTLVNDVAFKFLKKKDGESPVLLDAGCGRGHHTEKLRKMGYRTTGIDISEEDIAMAKSKFPENNFFRHDLNEKLPFPDHTFDVIFSNSVLQYIEWRKVILEYKRVLKPGGQALFLENLRGNPFARVYRMVMSTFKGYKKHFVPLQHLDIAELKLIAKEFNTVQMRFCILFSTLVILLPGTPRFGLRKFKVSVRRVLVNVENRLLVWFPSLSRYCSKVIIFVSRT